MNIMRFTLAALLALAALPPAHADIYFCLVNGVKTYSDQPCGEVEKVMPSTVQPGVVVNETPVPEEQGMVYGYQVLPDNHSSTTRSRRHSTLKYTEPEMRSYAEFSRVVEGMTPALVRRAWGKPDRSTGTHWVYLNMRGDVYREVFFSGGRVSSFSE
ncbi:hypothetical protein C4K68_13775 [Pokkaliibacter plantistimulans]|uniref:DUF4124 domain-containing protein n=2 Tax=Pseudomonadota TaxID=1224 RepID=A0A2S5KPQ7_9PROT|nr:hypothetical protein C4K68_13775 [Pokkaliibacter plantistimulans]